MKDITPLRSRARGTHAPRQHVEPTMRDWLSLGVLALSAADHSDNPATAEHFRALARLCDLKASTTTP